MDNQSFVPANPQYTNVMETWVAYDTAKIYAGSKNPPLEFSDFLSLAKQEDGIKFFSARTASDIGNAYTNITTRDNLQKPLWLESIGIDFHYPTPTQIPRRGMADMAAAKIFETIIGHHCYLQLITDEEVRTWIKPNHAPSGFGSYGGYQMIVPDGSNVFQGVVTNGTPHSSNRFVYLADLQIPAQTKITMVLFFSDYAKGLLNKIGQVGNFDFESGVYPGMAKIECTMRGIMGFQNRGQYKNPGAAY